MPVLRYPRVRLFFFAFQVLVLSSMLHPETAGAISYRRLAAPIGEAPSDWLGFAVDGAGDFNGDGHPDVIVAANLSDVGGLNTGRVYIHFGGPDMDAVPDLYLSGAAAGEQFGYDVAGVGDFNGDGFDDVVVGAAMNDAVGADAGRAYLYLGGAVPNNVSDLTLSGEAAGDQFGLAVGGAGDANGDGYDDIVVGAHANDGGGGDAGRAYLFYGGAVLNQFADWTLTGAAAGDHFGFSVSGAGDMDGDGYTEFVVGAYGNDAGGLDAGRAYVYFGTRFITTFSPRITVTAEAAGDAFGVAVSGAGDVNGDGHSDIIVGAYANDAAGSVAGRAYVYYGGVTANNVADLTLTGEASPDQFGRAVGAAGDVDGDGFDDVIVGAPEQGGTAWGRAYIFLGGSSPNTVADIVLPSEASGDRLGHDVAGAGDLTGDGFDDVVVGARSYDVNLGADFGRAFVIDVFRHVVVAPEGGDTWPVGATRAVSWLGDDLADVWLSPDGGFTWEKLAAARGGEPENEISLVVPHQPTRFARIRVTPSNTALNGQAHGDSLFTIEASIALLNLAATVVPAAAGGGVELTWNTRPGPDDLAGYRIEKRASVADSWEPAAHLVRGTSYRDASGTPGSAYRLIAVNGLGTEVVLGETSVPVPSMLAAWPLPYRGGELTLSFATSGGLAGRAAPTTLDLFDLSGRLVRRIVDGEFTAGSRLAAWDGRDAEGRDVPSGVYFLKIRTPYEQSEIKLAVSR